MLSKVQYISQGQTKQEQLNNIQSVLDAGCTWVQLRFKKAGEKEFLQTAEAVRKITGDYKSVFIINDDPFAAREIDAHGVHLGLTDMPVEEARKIIPGKIIGGTANTAEDVLKRAEEKCDYVGLGPFRFTTTKEKLSPIIGIDGYKGIMSALAEKNISIPVYAIGGIEEKDMGSLMHTGIYGIAVSGLLTKSKNKTALLQSLNATLNGTLNYC